MYCCFPSFTGQPRGCEGENIADQPSFQNWQQQDGSSGEVVKRETMDERTPHRFPDQASEEELDELELLKQQVLVKQKIWQVLTN